MRTFPYWPVKNDSAPALYLPQLRLLNLVSFMGLETNFVTANQFKANKPMEEFNNLLVVRSRMSLHGQSIKSQL